MCFSEPVEPVDSQDLNCACEPRSAPCFSSDVLAEGLLKYAGLLSERGDSSVLHVNHGDDRAAFRTLAEYWALGQLEIAPCWREERFS
jgi:hypothetical protein